MAVFMPGLHVGQADDPPPVVQKRQRQRDQRVLHPETVKRGLLEHEQHAVIGRHVRAVHQPLLPLGIGAGHLGLDGVPAHLQGPDGKGVFVLLAVFVWLPGGIRLIAGACLITGMYADTQRCNGNGKGDGQKASVQGHGGEQTLGSREMACIVGNFMRAVCLGRVSGVTGGVSWIPARRL